MAGPGPCARLVATHGGNDGMWGVPACRNLVTGAGSFVNLRAPSEHREINIAGGHRVARSPADAIRCLDTLSFRTRGTRSAGLGWRQSLLAAGDLNRGRYRLVPGSASTTLYGSGVDLHSDHIRLRRCRPQRHQRPTRGCARRTDEHTRPDPARVASTEGRPSRGREPTSALQRIVRRRGGPVRSCPGEAERSVSGHAALE